MVLLTGWWLVPVLTLLVGDGIFVGLVGLVNRLVQLLLLGLAAFFVASWWPELRQEFSLWQQSLFATRQRGDAPDDHRFLLEDQQFNLSNGQLEDSTVQADRIELHLDNSSEGGVLSDQSQAKGSSFRLGSTSLPSHFTGRQMELQELFQRVTQEGVRLVALQAEEAAVGKTVLAMKLAERLSPHYPDGHIFVDMQGSSDDPLSPQQAMKKIMRSYQPKAKLPQDEEELKSLYHSRLRKQRLLLLLDDVANPEQLESLLPTSLDTNQEAAGKAVLLITSRQYFVLPDMAVKRLGKLFADDARALLLRLAPRIEEEASELATLCSLHPLALRLAASMLAERGALIPAQYIWQMRDPERPFSKLSGLEKVFSLNYELMEEAEQRLWRMLALFSESFDQAAAAALWKLEADAAQEMLERFVAFSFVDSFSTTSSTSPPELGGIRYQLQKAMREFAESRLPTNERVTGQRCLAIHFETVLREANELYQQSSTQSEGLALFKGEWQNMQAGQAWAAGLVGQDKIASALSIAYPEVGLSLLIAQQPTKQLDWLKTAITATRHLKHREAECKYLGYLGQVHAELGQVRRAIGYYEQQLMISRELGTRLLEAHALANLGSGYMNLNNLRQAISYYEQQLMVTRNIVDSPEVRQREAKTLGPLGQAYQEMRQLDHAMSCYEQQLNMAHEFGDKQTESRALALLGNVHTELGDFSNALVCYGQHLTLERDLGHQAGQSQALGKLGNTYADMGDIQRALEYYEQQLIISRKIDNRELEGKALGNLGIAYAELGKTRYSIDYCTQALQIDRELGNKEGEAIGAWNLALIYYQLQKFALAVPLMQLTVDYERATGHPDAETHAHYLEIVRDKVTS